MDMCAIDVVTLHEYVASSLPSTFQESDKSFTSQRTAMWYLSVCENPASETWFSQCQEDHYCQTALDFQNNISSMMSEARGGAGDCLKELRSSLDVKGNADMAGIGVSKVLSVHFKRHLSSGQVMVSFCIEAFLIIAFLTAYAIAYLRRNRTQPSREKITDAFRAVLPTFYWNSVLLSLGIIVASLKASAEASRGGQFEQLSRWSKGDSIYSPYDMQLAAMASFLSALPPFMAGIMLRQSTRRRRLVNAIILPILVLLLIPVIVISIISQKDASNVAGQIIDVRLSETLIVKANALTGFCALFLVMLISWIVLRCRRSKKSGSSQVPSRHSIRMVVFTALVQVVLLAMMIGVLILFFFTRAKIIDAGDDSQLEWSFGQVLVLTTWIPVMVDFFYTICGKFHSLGTILLCYRD